MRVRCAPGNIRGLLVGSALAVLAGTVAEAADADGWETVGTGKVTIKARAHEGTQVREILAEGDLEAPAGAVSEAIVNADRFSKFMPYMKEAHFIGGPAEDGSRTTYTRLALPFIADRDFIITSRVTRPFAPDGGREFLNEWRAINTLPHRQGLVRVTNNTGSWRVKALGPARCHVIYQFLVDPGGGLPAWLADVGNRNGVPDVFKAVEKEALRLEAEKAAAARSAGGKAASP